MAGNPLLPKDLTLEVVTPEGLLLREQVDEVIAPGEEGYFGVLRSFPPWAWGRSRTGAGRTRAT